MNAFIFEYILFDIFIFIQYVILFESLVSKLIISLLTARLTEHSNVFTLMN